MEILLEKNDAVLSLFGMIKDYIKEFVEQPKYHSYSTLQKHLGVSRPTIDKWVNDLGLPKIVIEGRVLFHSADVDDFLERFKLRKK